jgi:acyl-CoA thioester hydrolase
MSDAIVRYTLPVHTFQVDFGGVVSNTVYVQWMEIGRNALLGAVRLPIERAWEQGIVPVLVHTSIDYKRPFRLAETVHAEVWISELKNTSAVMQHRFRGADGTLRATGEQVGLFVDRHTLKPHRLSDAQRALFERVVAPADAA